MIIITIPHPTSTGEKRISSNFHPQIPTMSDVQNVQQAVEAGQKKQVKRSLKKNVHPTEFNGPAKVGRHVGARLTD